MNLADLDPPIVAPGGDQEVAAWRAVTHGGSSIAVVDQCGPDVPLEMCHVWQPAS